LCPQVSAKKSFGRRDDQEVMLDFVIKANQTTAQAMTRLVGNSLLHFLNTKMVEAID
jgi:hypothetical protein